MQAERILKKVGPEVAANSAVDANQWKTLRVMYRILRAPGDNLMVTHFRVCKWALQPPRLLLSLDLFFLGETINVILQLAESLQRKSFRFTIECATMGYLAIGDNDGFSSDSMVDLFPSEDDCSFGFSRVTHLTETLYMMEICMDFYKGTICMPFTSFDLERPCRVRMEAGP